MAQDAAQKLVGKMIDEDTLEPVQEAGGCWVEFSVEAAQDDLLTLGGEIERKHPKVKEIRKLEQEALALLRQENPFTEPEPQPPAKDAPPAVQREYQQQHAEWDERRLTHDADLKEKATLLREHHEHKDLFVVSPAGRPIYVDREYIKIVTPGDKDNIPHRPVRPSDIEAYRAQYNRFKAGLSQATTGTPIEQLPGVSKSQVKELAYFNIRTVEQLVQTSDANLSRVGPYMALRQKAADWLKAARGMAPVNEARAEAERLKDEMKRQAEEIKQLRELLESQDRRRK